MVLADDDNVASGIAGYEVIATVWASVDRLAHAYATGDGVGWHEHDPRLFTGVDRFYRTFYRASLLTEWLPAVDGLVDRLESGIRVVDVGCGLGSATILMSEAFPASTFVGVDYHEESIRRATAAAEEAGVADRVSFEVGDASTYVGPYDLVCFFEALRDLGDPVGALAHARDSLAAGGLVVAVEPFAEDRFEDNLDNLVNPVALTFYVGSSALCVPHSISDGGAALGAQAGPARLTAAFVDGGFGSARGRRDAVQPGDRGAGLTLVARPGRRGTAPRCEHGRHGCRRGAQVLPRARERAGAVRRTGRIVGASAGGTCGGGGDGLGDVPARLGE